MNILILLIVALNSPAESIKVSFDSIPTLVVQHNAKVRAQKLQVSAAKKRTGFLHRSFIPNIHLLAGHQRFNAGSLSTSQPHYGFFANLNVYNGGLDSLQDKIFDIEVKKETLSIKIVSSSEIQKTREIYLKILHADKELQLLNKMISLNNKNRQSAESRIESGVANASDRFEFQIKSASLEQQIEVVVLQKKILLRLLRGALSLDEGATIILEGSLNHLDEKEKNISHNHSQHSFLTKSHQLQAEKLELSSLQKAQAWRPRIELEAGWSQLNQLAERGLENAKDRQESYIGLRLSMTLFENSAESAALRMESQAVIAKKNYETEQLEVETDEHLLELESLHRQVHSFDQQIGLAEQYYQMVRKDYSRGAKGSLDVLGASEKLEGIIRAKNKLLLDFHLTRTHTLAKVGL